MPCSMCHLSAGHTQTCAMRIETDWEPEAKLWVDLANVLFELWRDAEGAIHAGTKNEENLNTFRYVRDHVRTCIARHDARTAVELLRTYME